MGSPIVKAVVDNQSPLSKKDLNSNPFQEFDKWFVQAKNAGEPSPNAMCLATSSKTMQPSLRTVLLKYYDQEGFTFFTNYKSKKAREIAENPQVALKFFWPQLERQLIILGQAEKISKLQSLQYFMTRPEDSRIGAWCSDQSETFPSRSTLLSRFETFKSKFKDIEIPMPNHWGGYRVNPTSFEFWQGRAFRLHDRFKYTLTDAKDWNMERIAP